jgi:two-component system, NtrC family, response regulator AtoC
VFLTCESQNVDWVDGLERAIVQHPGHRRWLSFRVIAAKEAADARRLLDRTEPDLLSRTVVALERSVQPAEQLELLGAGAGDVLCCGDGCLVDAVLARLDRWAVIEETLASRMVRDRFIGHSPKLLCALRELIELAMFGRAPILLTGETGTGKELAAWVVHRLSTEAYGHRTLAEKSPGELVVVDCTTIVPTLSGSELFGHERGAFTGADRARIGAVKQADGGTLFLDEVGDLPKALQPELLRVIQEGRFKTVGGSFWARTSFRLVSATNRNLVRGQRHGRFRSDLYHRIAAGRVQLPPLRDRLEDVPELFRYFLAQARSGTEKVELTEGVCACLCEREYPGNVRQLRQLALQVAARHAGPGPVTVGDIPAGERPALPSPSRGIGKLRAAIRS